MKSTLGILSATSVLATLGALAPANEAPVAADPLDGLRATEAQANTYTSNAQEDPSLAIDAQGRILTTWSSRRQEQHTYGVFAQLLDPLGRPLGTEIHVNETLPGAQQDSYAVFAPDGSAWVAWSSLDPGTENNGIFLRRFADGAAGFGPAGPEIYAGGESQEFYTDPALAVNGAGELLLAWVKDAVDGISVEARRFSPAGEPQGGAFRLGAFEGAGQERMPDLVSTPDGAFVAVWQRAGEKGESLGLVGRRVSAAGALGPEFAVNDLPDRQHVEPSLAADGEGRLVVAWMSAAPGSADWEARARRFAADGAPLGASFAVDAGGEGYRNGATAVAHPDGRFLVAYNALSGVYEREDGRPARQADIYVRPFASDGSPAGPGRLLNAAGPGRHAMQAAVNGRHAVWSPAGPLAFAWGGRSLADESGVAVRILVPAGFDVPAPPPVVPVAACTDLVPDDVRHVVPPDPLPKWRRRLPQLPTEDFRAGGFIAHDQTGWSPPDPDLAVGPDMIISQCNMEIAAFDKSGTQMWRMDNNNYSSPYFYQSVGGQDFIFDPVSLYDWHSGRFIVANSELGSSQDYITWAISKDSHPDDANDWWKYRVQVSPTCWFPDFPNLGVSRDYISVTTDCFSGGGNRVMIFDKATVMSGGALVLNTNWWNQQMDASLQSLGNTKNYDTANAFQYYVSAGFYAGSSIRIQCKQTPTTAPNSYSLAVTSFGDPIDAPQLGTSSRLDTIDVRIKNGVVRNGKLYCAHGIGTGGVTKVRWYEINLNNWPTSGTPTLSRWGNLELGAGIYSWFPDIHPDSSGNVTIGYNRSAAAERASTEGIYEIGGVMQPPVRLVTSSAAYTGSRWGDYSGVEQDPASPTTFWGHAEYSVSAWQTWIGSWDVGGGPDPLADFSGTPTSGDEDLFVAFTDLSTGTGLYSWSWTFGDGGTSALQNPSYTYVNPGTYTVGLTVTGTNGSDTETKVGYIVVNDVFDATATPYNGLGINPNVLTSMSLPILGTNWLADIDGGSVGATGLTFLVGYSAPLGGVVFGPGELLIDVSSPWQFTSIAGGGSGISHHSVPIPADPIFAGVHSYAQGFLNNVGGAGKLTNAYDLALGY
ncbi:MAG: PKD domain-containing protein [Planctomycetota bacterium]